MGSSLQEANPTQATPVETAVTIVRRRADRRLITPVVRTGGTSGWEGAAGSGLVACKAGGVSDETNQPAADPPFVRPTGRAGQAYLVRPGENADEPGPGVLVLHSWWGLTPGIKEYCNRLSEEGFVVLAPDLLRGVVPDTAAEAEFELSESDPNSTAALVLASTVTLRSVTEHPDGPVAIIGFSMGASWALWAATRQPESFCKVVAHYGTQHIDFSTLTAQVQGHFAQHDTLVSADDLVEFESDLFELGHEPEFWHYEGTRHWFAEAGHDEFFDSDAAELAWQRTLAFLKR